MMFFALVYCSFVLNLKKLNELIWGDFKHSSQVWVLFINSTFKYLHSSNAN